MYSMLTLNINSRQQQPRTARNIHYQTAKRQAAVSAASYHMVLLTVVVVLVVAVVIGVAVIVTLLNRRLGRRRRLRLRHGAYLFEALASAGEHRL